jgi:hypothetical protein
VSADKRKKINWDERGGTDKLKVELGRVSAVSWQTEGVKLARISTVPNDGQLELARVPDDKQLKSGLMDPFLLDQKQDILWWIKFVDC